MPVAAFAGAVVGSALIYLAVRLGVPGIAGVGRAAAGVFIAQFLFGLVWACARLPVRAAATVTLLRYWLAGTAIILAGIAVWALAPVLIFFVLLAAALGLVSLAMIALARSLQALARPQVTLGSGRGELVQRHRCRAFRCAAGSTVFSSSMTPRTSGLRVIVNPALRARCSILSLVASVSPTMRCTPAVDARHSSLLEQAAGEALALPLVGHRHREFRNRWIGAADVARFGDHGLVPILEHLGDERQVVGVVDVGEALDQLRRQMAHRAHEPVVARRRRQIAEEVRRQPLVLGQHGADDHALPAGQPHHIDQLGWIAMDLIEHGALSCSAYAARPCRFAGSNSAAVMCPAGPTAMAASLRAKIDGQALAVDDERLALAQDDVAVVVGLGDPHNSAEAGDLLAFGAIEALHGPGREPDRLDFEDVFHGHLRMHALWRIDKIDESVLRSSRNHVNTRVPTSGTNDDFSLHA